MGFWHVPISDIDTTKRSRYITDSQSNICITNKSHRYSTQKCTSPTLQQHVDMGVTIQWIGLLDWNTGLDYWTRTLDCTTGLTYFGFCTFYGWIYGILLVSTLRAPAAHF